MKSRKPFYSSWRYLRRRRNRARRALSLWTAIPDAVFEVDRQGVFLRVVPPKSFSLYLPAERFLGRRMDEVLPPEVARLGMQALQRALHSGEPQTIEYPLTTPEGAQYYEARLVANSAETALIIVRQITDRLQAEQTLRLQEERYRRIVEDMPALICRFRADGTLTYVNQHYCDYFGAAKSELEGRNFFEFIPLAEQAAVRQHYASLDAEHPVVTYIHQARLPDGSLRWQRWTDRALCDEQGNVIEYQSIGIDITQSYVSQLELKASQELLCNTLRAAHAGVWEWNILTNQLTWSDESYVLLGLEPGSVPPTYQAWMNAIIPEDRNRIATQVMNAIQHRANLDVEYRVHHPDGSMHWLRSVGNVRLDEQGKVVAMFGIVLEITSQKQIEQEIRSLNEALEQRIQARTAELEAANRDLESFAYSVSHDLRSPLRGVEGYARLLQEGYASLLPGEAQELLANILKYTHRMSTLIDALLQFSRLGRKEPTRQMVDMRQLAQSVMKRLIEQEPERQIEVHIAALPPAQADPTLIEQVWVNLCSNALKYTRLRPLARIEIGVQDSSDEAAYFIRDNGVGFDMKYADRLFGVFQRLHLADEFEGVGIGLANVKRIIERHGGKVWAHAEPDRGATFYFTLPPIGQPLQPAQTQAKA